MFNNKKGKIMRHPYATMAVLGLATVGVITISQKVKAFCGSKTKCFSSMMMPFKHNSEPNYDHI